MAKFHVSADGNARACKASKDNCPLAADINHYDTADEARAGYEKLQQFRANRTLTRTTSETRMAKLPEVKGVVYEKDAYGEGVTEDGQPYTSIDAFREKRNGERSRVAAITVYDDGSAIVWDRTEANEADIRSRDNLRDALKSTFEISAYSSPVFFN